MCFFYKKSQTKAPQFLRGLIDYLRLLSQFGISEGNDKSKSRVQIVSANLASEPRARYFCFLSFSKRIPNRERKLSIQSTFAKYVRKTFYKWFFQNKCYGCPFGKYFQTLGNFAFCSQSWRLPYQTNKVLRRDTFTIQP